jgi:kumamolisin
MSNVQLANSVHALPAGSVLQHKTRPGQWIEVTLSLKRQKALPSLAALENKKPRDRKYMTRDQLEKDYAPSPDAIKKITDYAEAHHMKVTRIEPGSARLRLAGTVQDVSSAFGVSLFDYKHDKLGSFHARTGPVSVPQELSGLVTGVFGFNNYRRLRRNKATPHATSEHSAEKSSSAAHVAVLHPKSAKTVSPQPGTFTPPQVAALYNYPQGNGQGECIALLEFGGGVEQDSITAYFQNLNITPPNVLTIPVDNVSTDPSSDPDSTGEVMLDIEVAGSICPGATIAVYFSTFDEKGLIDAISAVIADKTNDPSVCSISWGWDENQPLQNSILWTPAAIDAIGESFLAAAQLGITVCVSTGDDGSEAQIKDGNAHCNYPATDPSVLAVGGTTLHSTGNPPAIATEVVWNDGPGSGTGGGVSDYVPVPAWQNGIVPKSINPGNFAGRAIPDVAANADPDTGYLTYSGGQFGTVGGTSAAAPMWGSLIALCNQQLGARVGNFNTLLYSTIGPAKVLNDITQGDNDTDGLLNGEFPAGPGWDACTGWGTPNGQELLNALK